MKFWHKTFTGGFNVFLSRDADTTADLLKHIVPKIDEETLEEVTDYSYEGAVIPVPLLDSDVGAILCLDKSASSATVSHEIFHLWHLWMDRSCCTLDFEKFCLRDAEPHAYFFSDVHEWVDETTYKIKPFTKWNKWNN